MRCSAGFGHSILTPNVLDRRCCGEQHDRRQRVLLPVTEEARLGEADSRVGAQRGCSQDTHRRSMVSNMVLMLLGFTIDYSNAFRLIFMT
jgi:hypothetical protein